MAGVGLTELIGSAAANANIVVGTDDGLSADALCTSGARCFSPAADASAVAAVMTNDVPTVELVLGAITAGAELVSLPIPARGDDVASYISLAEQVCAQRGATTVVARDDVASMLCASGVNAIAHSELGKRALAQPCRDGFRLVQFSSGSTGLPTAIELGSAELGANVSAILEVLRPRRGDAVVSWLPLSHDMGLIGMLLASIAGTADEWAGPASLVFLDPRQFLRRPSIWLDALHEWGGTITASPDFGYRLATDRGGSADRDLSRLRCAIVGGEIVRSTTLTRFAERFESSGLSATALCPAYGMAEIGVAASLTAPEERWREKTLSRGDLAESVVAPPSSSTSPDAQITLISSGTPLPGYRVSTSGDDDGVAPLRVQGPSVGRDAITRQDLCGPDGFLTPGDLGFVDDHDVYVCGRGDDYLVAHGRNIYVPPVEEAIGSEPDVRSGRVAVIGTHDGECVVLFEGASDGAATPGRLVEAVRRAAVRASAAQPHDVLLLRRGTLPVTSSGKLRRQEARRQYLLGELDLAAVATER